MNISERILLFFFAFIVGGVKNVFCVEESELISVVIIFRHGARTIVQPYPNDPYKNESLWPADFGQLTNQGKLQHYELGQYFRNRYKDFLPLKYTEKQIYIRSTDVDRTLMSAAANLAGLFPPKDKEIWDKDIPWQPIPIHTVPEYEDAFLAFKKPCERYNVLYEELMNSDEIQKINRDNRDLYDYLNLHSGAKIDDFDEMEYLYNTLTIEKSNNFTLPDWTKAVFPDKMKGLADFSFALPCFTRDLARFKTGPFFYDLLEYYKSVTTRKNNTEYIKFKIFSGHDTTVANILESLKLFEYHSPPFTSSIIFELYENSTDHYVNILYKNSSELKHMVLNGCDFNCPLENFNRLIEPLTITMVEWHKECEMSLFANVTENKENMIIALILLILTICIIGIFVKLICGKSKKDRTVYLRLPDDEEQV